MNTTSTEKLECVNVNTVFIYAITVIYVVCKVLIDGFGVFLVYRNK